MKTTAFEQIKMSLQRTKGYTANKMSKLADATVAAIEELDERKANAEEITQKIDTTIQNGTDIKNLIGQTENTGGTTTTGTIMAKLNKLLTDWTNSRATKIDTINTNVSNLNTRLTSTRASRLDNIGTTTDTGGSATAGTIMAKLNKLITDEANSGSGDIGTVNDNIGKTTDTGGTTSAGTVMAKLNKLLTDWTTTRAGYITNLNSRLTSTRASRLDNIGTTTDTGGTATAGTIMAKLNALLGSGSSGTKIKSIQHGYVAISSNIGANFEIDENKNRKIKISTVNSSKAILFSFNEIYMPGSSGINKGLNRVPILYNSYLLQPYFNASGSTHMYSAFSYCIIEFY